MIIAKFTSSNIAHAYGLTQWDYGQELAIESAGIDIPDNTEVQFYQGTLSHTAYLKNRHVLVPDLMLQNACKIISYVYVRSETSGETILSIEMPVRERERPDNYVLPEYRDYMRLLPEGGKEGQYLGKESDEDFEVGWKTLGAMGGYEEMTDEDIDEICGM